jgi:hypothetical protein
MVVSIQEMSHKGGPAVVEVTTAVVMTAINRGERGSFSLQLRDQTLE